MKEQRRRTATASALAEVNRTAILEAFSEFGVMSRQQIVEQTGLSPATVNRLTSALVKEGIVTSAGLEPSTGGRRAILLRQVGHSRVVLAIQLTHHGAVGVLVDFDGRIVFRHEMKLDPPASRDAGPASQRAKDQPQEQGIKRVLGLVDLLLNHAEELGTPCRGIGVAVSGIVRFPRGVIRNIPGLGWDGVELGQLLKARTSLPIVVDNDANALAFGQQRRGAGQGAEHLVAIVLESGLGAGIMTNGRLHRGANSEAGEIGYLLMGTTSLRHVFSDYGDLERHLGPESLTQAALSRGMKLPPKTTLTASDILAMASDGQPIAVEIADDILDVIAVAVAAIVTILDPDVVVLGGSLVRGSNQLIPAVRARLAGRILQQPRIESATIPHDAVLLGAAELAISEANSFTYLGS